MVADVCVHDPEPVPGGPRNRHAHILCTVRGFDGGGWAKTKDRSWNDKALLRRWRESWSSMQNTVLEAAGCVGHVDHRSLEDQRGAALDAGDMMRADALDRPPEPVLGVAASVQEKRARIVAARRGEEYRPVTARGRALEKFRELRLILTSAWGRLHDATKNITMASAMVENLFEQSPVPVENPFLAVPGSPEGHVAGEHPGPLIHATRRPRKPCSPGAMKRKKEGRKRNQKLLTRTRSQDDQASSPRVARGDWREQRQRSGSGQNEG